MRSTGWITHWGESMANTSAAVMIKTLGDILSYQNNTGSVNLYMAYGGSNFGYWAGAAHCKLQVYGQDHSGFSFECKSTRTGRRLLKLPFLRHSNKLEYK